MTAQIQGRSTADFRAGDNEPEYDWYDVQGFDFQGGAAMSEPLPHHEDDIPQQGLCMPGNPPGQDIGQANSQLRGAAYHYIAERHRMHAIVLRLVSGQPAGNCVFVRTVFNNQAAVVQHFA